MGVNFKDKDGNIIAKPLTVLASDEQVEKAITNKIADGTIDNITLPDGTAINTSASSISVKDTGNYFESDKMEDVLQEIGKFLPPGLVVGVKMTTDQALKDIKTFSDQVMQAAQLGDFTNSYQVDTGNISTTNISNQTGTIAAINDLKRAILQQNNEIDYNKLKDCFVEGAKTIDGTIVMDNTVVGKKVAEPVRSTNKLVLERLNRLEGI